MTNTESIDTSLTECDWCNEWHDSVDSAEHGDYRMTSLCIDCQETRAFICDCCSSLTDSANGGMYSTGRYEYQVCEPCIQNYYEYCHGCGEYYHEDNPCNECNDRYDDDEYDNDGIIKEYNYRPNPKFFVREVGTNQVLQTKRTEFITSNPFMGFELEIEVPRNSNPDEIAEGLLDREGNWMYCKYDGSLNYGFEIVTHPHTLNSYNSRSWSWLEYLKNQGCRSWNTTTCGLHVHINKSAFQNNSHIWKFTNLVLYNRNPACKLAGRRDNQWSSFYTEYKKVGKILKGDESPERYTAVNLRNFNTIEVRMFRGSLHEPRLRSALEFVNANFEYTKGITAHDVLKNDALNWSSFTEWVQSYESTYPHLNHYLTKIKERLKVDVSTLL